MSWVLIKDAPLKTPGFVWCADKTWDNRTDVLGTVHENVDGSGRRAVSSVALGWSFTHWHPLIEPPKVK